MVLPLAALLGLAVGGGAVTGYAGEVQRKKIKAEEDDEFLRRLQLQTAESEKLAKIQSKLRVTEKENEIFNFLISQKNDYVSRERLLIEIWNYNKEIDTHTLETHVYSLRKKIDEKLQLKDLIIYKEKKGYVINSDFL